MLNDPFKFIRGVVRMNKFQLTGAATQFFVLVVISLAKWHFFNLTQDFALYAQAAFLIAHGHWNPFSTILGYHFVANDLELLIWPIGVVVSLTHSIFSLLIIQSVAIATSTFLCLKWVGSLVVHIEDRRSRKLLLYVGTILLGFSPWIYWSASFDVHLEPIVLPFLIMAARSFWEGRNHRGTVFALIVLGGGTASIPYISGIGLMLLFRKRFTVGVLLLLGPAIALVIVEHLISLRGVSLSAFYSGYVSSQTGGNISLLTIISGILHHPLLVLKTLWNVRANMWGELSSAGLLGLASPIGLGVPFIVLMENNLILAHARVTGLLFGTPQSYQGIAIAFFGALGTIDVLKRLHKPLSQRLWTPIVILLGANTLIWSITWMPRISSQYITNIPESAVSGLNVALRQSTPGTEVVASNAFIGRFAARKHIYLAGVAAYHIPVVSHRILFVLSAYDGILLSQPTQELQRIAYLSSLPNVKLLSRGNGGVWAFLLNYHGHDKFLNIDQGTSMIPSWDLHHPAGQVILNGPSELWRVSSRGKPGYIVDGLYYRARRGKYVASIKYSSTTAMLVEVWNSTGSLLVLRRWIPATNGQTRTQTFPFENSVQVHRHPNFFTGFGLWSITPAPPPNSNNIEMRVWSNGHGESTVYSARIMRS